MISRHGMNARIGFSTSSAWYSQAIRWFTRSKISHTFLLLSVFGHEMVLEEGVFGWSMRTFGNFKHGNKVVHVVQFGGSLDAAVGISFDWLGQRYDYLGVAGMLPIMIGRFFGKRMSNLLASRKSMFCSEANTKILQAAGYPKADQLHAAETSPQDLLEFLVPVWPGKLRRRARSSPAMDVVK